ncbi:MAG: hypothetical protein QW734_02935 [Candidatus Bathyarchaeia archaeon]
MVQYCTYCGRQFKNIASVRKHLQFCPMRAQENIIFEKLRLVIVACRAFSDPNFQLKLDDKQRKELIGIKYILKKQNERAKSGSVAWFLERLDEIL